MAKKQSEPDFYEVKQAQPSDRADGFGRRATDYNEPTQTKTWSLLPPEGHRPANVKSCEVGRYRKS